MVRIRSAPLSTDCLRVWRAAKGQVEEQRHGGHQDDQDDRRESAHGGEQLGHDGHTSTVRSEAVTGLGLR